MAYVRKRGNQVAIVHGQRDTESGKVRQTPIFTFYSKAEVREAIGEGGKDGSRRFRALLEHQFPQLKFNWKKLSRDLKGQLESLPETYTGHARQIEHGFRSDLLTFAKQLILADPQELVTSAELIKCHRHELEYIQELIQWRIQLCDQKPTEWNGDNAFKWHFTLPGRGVPCETEEHAESLYAKGELEKAEAVFRMLLNLFEDYADGHNFLGYIARDREQKNEAIRCFRKAAEVGRRLFPKRIAKSSYWSDHKTRPYIRALCHLADALTVAEQHEAALEVCDQLEYECYQSESSETQRSLIFLNLGRWENAATLAARFVYIWPSHSFVAAFAAYEAGQPMDSLEHFLHGALNLPRTARMLLDLESKPTECPDEVRDHNTGVSLARSIEPYLSSAADKARHLLRAFFESKQVSAMVSEVESLVERRKTPRSKGYRLASERLREMRTPEYAKAQVREIAPRLLERRIPIKG